MRVVRETVTEAWIPRKVTMACGCHRKIGGGKKVFKQLWCEAHKWQVVTNIEHEKV